MRVLVTGSRDWPWPSAVARELDALYDEFLTTNDHEFVVVHGDCPTGADRHAVEWVEAMNDGDAPIPVSHEPHPADWSQGRKAGPERNLRMVRTSPDRCLAFISACTSPRCGLLLAGDPPHPSHGASGCANLASGTGIPTRRLTA